MGMGVPVFFTCRNRHLRKCSFDTRQYHHIEWKTPEDLKKQLQYRIEASNRGSCF